MMLLLVIVLLCLPVILFYIIVQKSNHTNNNNNSPPGPKPLPLIGNLHHLQSSQHLHHHLWNLSRRYGPLMFFRLGSVPTLIVSSAKMADLILKTHDRQFAGRPSLLGQRTYSYNCTDLVFSPHGDYWRELRKLCVVHLFSPKRVNAFRAIFEDEVRRIINTTLKIATWNTKGVASSSCNLSETARRFTSSIICRTAFGKRYENDEGEGLNARSKFHELLDEEQEMISTFYFTDHFPVFGYWVDWMRGALRRLHNNFKDLDDFYQQIIDDHVNFDPNTTKHDEDFIDVCLGLMKDRSFSIQLTYDHIKALLTDIFVAGTDTGAAVLVWAMTALIKNPRVMMKVIEEVRKLNPEKDMLDQDDIEKLHYLKAVLKETMRLFPPAPLMVPRETTEKCKIGEYEIEAKTIVYFNVWGIGRDPEAWENPEEFNPERYLNEGGTVEIKGQEYGLITFGGGRRICPGMHMGMAMVELAIANLVRIFDWELPKGMKIEDIDTDVIPGITMHKKNALCLVPRISASFSSISPLT